LKPGKIAMTPDQTALLPIHSPVIAGASRVGREQGFLHVNPDLYALWVEFTFNEHQAVQTSAAHRIQSAMRAMEGNDFMERLRFVAAAAESECPGLWSEILHAGPNAIDEADHAHQMDCREAMAKANSLSSDAMRGAMLKQISDRHEKYVQALPGRNPNQ
jgi:hypothetical protein